MGYIGYRDIDKARATNRASKKRVAARLMQELRQYKLLAGCADCGYDERHEALQFDHLPGTVKVATVGSLALSAKVSQTWAEVAKCEVVCANCHCIRTAARRLVV